LALCGSLEAPYNLPKETKTKKKNRTKFGSFLKVCNYTKNGILLRKIN
jgi:hypothetical protein